MGDHQREADGRVDAVTTADPVPELEHVRRIDAECPNLVGVGGDRDEMIANCVGGAEMTHEPVAGGLRVGHRFDRGERLGCDDEQRARRVEVAGGFPDVGTVDVGHESNIEMALAVAPQGFVTHSPGRGRYRRYRC
jgi:hypothetical protein